MQARQAVEFDGPGLEPELDDQAARAQSRDDAIERLTVRREALDREERLRVTELRQKNSLRLELRLLNLLAVLQPKLLVAAEVTSASSTKSLSRLPANGRTRLPSASP